MHLNGLIIDKTNKRLIGDKLCIPLDTIRGYFSAPANNQVIIATTWGTIGVPESTFTSQIQNSIIDFMNHQTLDQPIEQKSIVAEANVNHRLVFRRSPKSGTFADTIEMCIQSKTTDGKTVDNFVQVLLYECALKISNNFRHFLDKTWESNKTLEFFSGNEPRKMILNKKSNDSIISIQIANKNNDWYHISFDVSSEDFIIDNNVFI